VFLQLHAIYHHHKLSLCVLLLLQDSVQLLKKGSFNRRHNAGLATVKLASPADVARCCNLLDGKLLQVGADAASSRPLIVCRNKFECCQLGYVSQQQQGQEQDSCDADS
jgi:hypothetical protein